MDDSQHNPDLITGTTTYYAKVYQPNSIIKNTVTYSVTGPTVSIIEDFNSGNDS